MENKKEQCCMENYAPKFTFRFKASCTDAVAEHADDFILVAICLSGKGEANIDGVDYEYKKGDLLVINAGLKHSFAKSNALMLYVGVDNIQCTGMTRNTLPLESPRVGVSRYKKEIENCCNDISRQMDQKDWCWCTMVDLMCSQLFLWIIREVMPVDPGKQEVVFHVESYERSAIVNTMKEFFNQNYMHHISMAEIAGEAFLSTTYLTRIFKEATGKSPIDYLISVRLERACVLLEDKRYSVQEVAKNVGYDDPYYFSKLFKKYVGAAPSHYKRGSRAEE